MARLKLERSAGARALAGRLAVLLALVLGQATGNPANAASDAPCRPVIYEGSEFVVCTADLRQHQVRLFWKGPDGQPIGSFDQLRQTPFGSRLIFAMNGGMYHEDRSPVGLYVENGQELKRANTANGPGNFHLKPNGVFFIKGNTAGVMETSRYLKQRLRPDLRDPVWSDAGDQWSDPSKDFRGRHLSQDPQWGWDAEQTYSGVCHLQRTRDVRGVCTPVPG